MIRHLVALNGGCVALEIETDGSYAVTAWDTTGYAGVAKWFYRTEARHAARCFLKECDRLRESA